MVNLRAPGACAAAKTPSPRPQRRQLRAGRGVPAGDQPLLALRLAMRYILLTLL